MQLKFRCPNCGYETLIDENVDSYKCPYCKSVFSVNELKKDIVDTNIVDKIDKAIELRNNCDFDDAEEILEDLLVGNPTNAEIYFQLLLCDFGVSYVAEDNSIREKPVISRLQKESVFDKENYQRLKEILVDNPSKTKTYNDRLQDIDNIRKKSLEIMNKVEPFDVFISYKRMDGDLYTKDSETARKLYTKFTSWGYKVFFAQETIYKEFGGKVFEPIIYSALMSSKVFVLVCSSPDKKEYLLSPWVKNEWQRYKKRIETEQDDNLLLLPVFDNGYSPDKLPAALRKIEGIKLDDEFDRLVYKMFEQTFSKSKTKNVNKINIQTKDVKINLVRQDITINKLKSYEQVNLNASDKAEYALAVQDMNFKSEKKFNDASKRLNSIIENNNKNYLANLAKVKCDMRISFDESFSSCNIKNIDDFETLKEDTDNHLSEVLNELTRFILCLMSSSPKVFVADLLSNNSLTLTVASSFKDEGSVFEFLQKVQNEFLIILKAYADGGRSLYNEDKINTILDELFRKVYSNYDIKGALAIANLYKRSALLFTSSVKHQSYKALTISLLSKAYEINPKDNQLIWYLFLVNNDIFEESDDKIVNNLAKNIDVSKYYEYPPNDELPSFKYNLDNLYYLIIALAQNGYVYSYVSEEDNYFSIILRVALAMTNIPKKRYVAKKIFETIVGLHSGNDKTNKQLLLTIANRLLIEEDYDEAKKYYNQILSINNDDLDAYWGLSKCELFCPTNYGTLLIKKPLSSSSNFKVLLDLCDKLYSNIDNTIYMQLYSSIEKAKNSDNREKRKLLFSIFGKKQKNLLDSPIPEDDSLEEVISLFGKSSEELRTTIEDKPTEERLNNKKPNKLNNADKPRPHVYREKKIPKDLLSAKVIFSYILLLGNFASIFVFDPLITLATTFVTLVVLRILVIGTKTALHHRPVWFRVLIFFVFIGCVITPVAIARCLYPSGSFTIYMIVIHSILLLLALIVFSSFIFDDTLSEESSITINQLLVYGMFLGSLFQANNYVLYVRGSPSFNVPGHIGSAILSIVVLVIAMFISFCLFNLNVKGLKIEDKGKKI